MNKNSKCQCPLCNGESALFYDFAFWGSDGSIYHLFKCKNCDTVFTGPRPSNKVLQKEYGTYYWNDTDLQEKRRGLSRLVASFNSLRLKQVIKPLLKVLPPNATVLEIGCGAGQLSQILLHNGINVEVTEYSPQILNLVTEKLGIKGYLGDLAEIKLDRHYDAVIFNNVLEHVLSPLDNLRSAAFLLNPSGFIFIELPNINSLQFKIFKKRWYPLDIPVHLTHFEPATLDNLARQIGLSIKKRSFFSMRSSVAGIVVSIFPSLDPRHIRRKGGLWRLVAYLILQIFFFPLSFMEGLLGRGGIMRVLYSK